VTLRAGLADFVRIVSGADVMGSAIMEERLVVDGDVSAATAFAAATRRG
jgi:hypothetical protein